MSTERLSEIGDQGWRHGYGTECETQGIKDFLWEGFAIPELGPYCFIRIIAERPCECGEHP